MITYNRKIITDPLVLRYSDDGYEWIVNAETGEILAEGHKICAEDVLYALGYRFECQNVDDELDEIEF